MILETLRIVRDWLNDGTNGVNAKLPSVPLDGSDTQPANVAAILEETASIPVALKYFDKDQSTPAIWIWQADDADFVGLGAHVVQSFQEAQSLPVAIAYVDRESNTGNAVRDGSYVMRAVRMSLNVRHQNAQSANRLRNSVQVLAGGIRSRLVKPNVELEGAVVTHGMIIVYQVRDNAP